MLLASLEDINVHLPEDKLVALDSDEDSSSLDAERIIKAKLSGTFSPAVLASWDEPDSTPETIRAIAGRLVAALYYSRAFSAEQTEAPEYSQSLYNEGMALLDQVVSGMIVLPEVDDDDQPSTGNDLTSADFTPNDDTTPGPMFSVSDVW